VRRDSLNTFLEHVDRSNRTSLSIFETLYEESGRASCMRIVVARSSCLTLRLLASLFEEASSVNRATEDICA
jgi:hypothetical protein